MNGRQVSYPDTEFIPEVDGETGGSGGGFIQQIFDMIKNLLGSKIGFFLSLTLRNK